LFPTFLHFFSSSFLSFPSFTSIIFPIRAARPIGQPTGIESDRMPIFFSDFSSLRRRTQVNNATARVQTKKPAALPNGKSTPFRPEFRKLPYSPYKKALFIFHKAKLLKNGYYRMSM
jgi:hypothetical protein